MSKNQLMQSITKQKQLQARKGYDKLNWNNQFVVSQFDSPIMYDPVQIIDQMTVNQAIYKKIELTPVTFNLKKNNQLEQMQIKLYNQQQTQKTYHQQDVDFVKKQARVILDLIKKKEKISLQVVKNKIQNKNELIQKIKSSKFKQRDDVKVVIGDFEDDQDILKNQQNLKHNVMGVTMPLFSSMNKKKKFDFLSSKACSNSFQQFNATQRIRSIKSLQLQQSLQKNHSQFSQSQLFLTPQKTFNPQESQTNFILNRCKSLQKSPIKVLTTTDSVPNKNFFRIRRLSLQI